MRQLENYEVVLSGEGEDRLLLTFDWNDLPNIPKSVSSVVCDKSAAQFRVIFEDDAHWEEVHFVNLPESLFAVVAQFQEVYVVGLSDKVEMFAQSPLQHL